MRSGWLSVLIAVSLIPVGPAAQADHTPETVQVENRTIEDPIDPLGDPASLVLDVQVPCTDNETATSWTRASLADAPGFVVFQSTSVSNLTTEVCHDAEDTLAVGIPIEVGVTQEAPAFQQVTATVEVRVQKNHTGGNVTHLDPVETEIALTPGYFSLYNARLERKVVEGEPQSPVRYPIKIDNYSNGPTRFEFALANPEGVPSGFQPVVPEPVILQSNATGGTQTSGNVVFSVFTPYHNGYVNEVGAVQLRIDSFYAGNEDIQGQSTHLSTLTRAKGFYLPGPGAAVGLLAMAGVALTLQCRRARS